MKESVKDFVKKYKVINILSLVVFVIVMSKVFSWQFGLGLTLMLLLHEGGHMLALILLGIPFRGAFFIPFMGAVISPLDMTALRNRKKEYLVAIAGPIGGLLFSLAALVVYSVNRNEVVLALAGVCALINLVNLSPFCPLDGGRIVRSIAYSGHKMIGHASLVLGIVGLSIVTVRLEIFIFGLVAIGALDELAAEVEKPEEVEKMGWSLMTIALLSYLLLGLALVLIILASMGLPGYQSGYSQLL